ncbi:MAG: hypothetical protein JXX29_08665 [Deltaproteobacteria bacterium]|nr:hypothetical protein [Deltaproteobacteria bacterium]MBN2671732.1 hypothetical protein [Deltaproteobacteria bacterium]
MAERISLRKVFDRLSEVEQLAADLYSHYASVFADVGFARELFLAMKDEELNHKSQVEMQKRILARSPGGFDMVDVDMSGIDNLVQKVRAEISATARSLSQALDFAIALEKGSMESAYRTVIARHHSDLSSLVAMLSAGDKQHISRLERLRDSLSREGTSLLH